MKKLWNLISIIAFVNLLAVLGFGGWLWSSGRMDKEKLKAMLEAPPPPADPNANAEAPPPEPEGDLTPTTLKIDAGERQTRREAMSSRRLNEEKDQLDKELEDREQKLAAERDGFKAERDAWEASMASTKAAKTDEQFRKAVKLLENVPAKQGKEWILELVKQGETDQAVAYLDTMSSFKATALLKAFKGDEETKVATELLEKLRQRTPSARPVATSGEGAAAPATPADAVPAPLSSSSAKPPAAKPAAKPAAGAQPASSKPGPAPADGKRPVESGKPLANTGAAVDDAAKPGDKRSGSGAGKPDQKPDQEPEGKPDAKSKGAGEGKPAGDAVKH